MLQILVVGTSVLFRGADLTFRAMLTLDRARTLEVEQRGEVAVSSRVAQSFFVRHRDWHRSRKLTALILAFPACFLAAILGATLGNAKLMASTGDCQLNNTPSDLIEEGAVLCIVAAVGWLAYCLKAADDE